MAVELETPGTNQPADFKDRLWWTEASLAPRCEENGRKEGLEERVACVFAVQG